MLRKHAKDNELSLLTSHRTRKTHYARKYARVRLHVFLVTQNINCRRCVARLVRPRYVRPGGDRRATRTTSPEVAEHGTRRQRCGNKNQIQR